jgi:hypothetical protein
MINPKHNPVEWALLVNELSEAHEHLGALISKLGSASEYDEEWLRVDMGHLMAHLNHAWARRNCARSLTDEEWEQFREYPQDLRPIA